MLLPVWLLPRWVDAAEVIVSAIEARAAGARDPGKVVGVAAGGRQGDDARDAVGMVCIRTLRDRWHGRRARMQGNPSCWRAR